MLLSSSVSRRADHNTVTLKDNDASPARFPGYSPVFLVFGLRNRLESRRHMFSASWLAGCAPCWMWSCPAISSRCSE